MRFTEEQELFRKTVRDFAQTELAEELPEILRTGMVSDHLYKRAGDLGLIGVVCPSELPNGTGLGYVEMAIIYEELAKVSPGYALNVEIALNHICILRKTQALTDKYVGRLNSGEIRLGAGFTPPEGQPNVTEHKPAFKKVDGGYICNATRLYISNGDAFLVDCQGLDEDGNSILGFFERDWEGVSSAPLDEKLGQAGNHGCTITFKDAFVPDENVCPMAVDSSEEMYWSVYAGCAAEALGCAEGLFERAREFCETHTHNGKPLTCMSGVSYKLADLWSKIVMCKTMVYECADMEDQLRLGDMSILDEMLEFGECTKIRVPEELMDVSYELIKLMGGMGYHDINSWRFVGDQLDYCIMDMPTEAHIDFLASRMGLPR